MFLSKLRKHVKLSPADGVDMEDNVRFLEVVWLLHHLASLDLECGRISVPLDQVANLEQVLSEFFKVKNIVFNAVSYVNIKVDEGSVNVSDQTLNIMQLLLCNGFPLFLLKWIVLNSLLVSLAKVHAYLRNLVVFILGPLNKAESQAHLRVYKIVSLRFQILGKLNVLLCCWLVALIEVSDCVLKISNRSETYVVCAYVIDKQLILRQNFCQSFQVSLCFFI